MVFFRNLQVRWTPIQGHSRATIALERPRAGGDAGVYADRIEVVDDGHGPFNLSDIAIGWA